MSLLDEASNFAKILNKIKDLDCLIPEFRRILNGYSQSMNRLTEKLSENPDIIYEDENFLKKLISTMRNASARMKSIEKILDKNKAGLEHDVSYRVYKEAVHESISISETAEKLYDTWWKIKAHAELTKPAFEQIKDMRKAEKKFDEFFRKSKRKKKER